MEAISQRCAQPRTRGDYRFIQPQRNGRAVPEAISARFKTRLC